MENKPEDRLMAFKGELGDKTRRQIIDACSHLRSSDQDIIEYILDVALNPRKYSDEQYWKGLCIMAQASEQQRQVIADTWDAALRRKYYENANISGLWKREEIPPTKEQHLNNLFPSEIKGEQQTK